MNLKFKQLTIDNFLSFKHAELNFESISGYTLVTGRNTNPDDNSKSNGSGKSAIFESISWCLTGETIRGSKNVSNLYTSDSASVELEFTINSNTYKVIRTKDPSNLKFFVNDEDKSGKGIRDTEKVLEQYLPDITPQLLGSVILLGQGLPQRFTNNPPSGRKEVLEKLFKTDFMISDIKDRITSREISLKENIRTLEDLILASSSKKDVYENQKNSDIQSLDYFNSIDLSSTHKLIKELERDISDYDTKIVSQSEQQSDLNLKLSTGMRELNQENSNYSEAVQKFINRHKFDDNSFTENLSQQKAEIKTLESKITELKNIKDVCPTCHRKLEGVEKPDTTLLEEKLSTLKESYSIKLKEYDDFKSTLEKERQDIDTTFNSKLAEIRNNNTNLQSQIEIINRNITGMNQEKTKLLTKKNENETLISSFQSKKEALIESIQNADKNIEKLDDEIVYNTDRKSEFDNRLSVLNKISNLSTKEFRGVLLEDIIKNIDEFAKSYCKIVFNTELISFELSGNNISIKYSDKDYENLSSGERAKVDIIVQFAIRASLASNVGFSSNILVLDEVFDALDSVGCDNVINLISTQLTDVEDIFIVTHRADLEIPADNFITVTKGIDKISELMYN